MNKHGVRVLTMVELEMFTSLCEIAHIVAATDTTYSNDFMDNYCIFCHGEENYEDPSNYKHEDTCIVVKARALVAGMTT